MESVFEHVSQKVSHCGVLSEAPSGAVQGHSSQLLPPVNQSPRTLQYSL